jgi:hypothetical protein
VRVEWEAAQGLPHVVADVDDASLVETVRVGPRIVSRLPRERAAEGHRFVLEGKDAHAIRARTPLGLVWKLTYDGVEVAPVPAAPGPPEPLAPVTSLGTGGGGSLWADAKVRALAGAGIFFVLLALGWWRCSSGAQRRLVGGDQEGDECENPGRVQCAKAMHSKLLRCGSDGRLVLEATCPMSFRCKLDDETHGRCEDPHPLPTATVPMPIGSTRPHVPR